MAPPSYSHTTNSHRYVDWSGAFHNIHTVKQREGGRGGGMFLINL